METVSKIYFPGSHPVIVNQNYGGFSLDAYLLDQFKNIFGPGNFNPYNPSLYCRTHPAVISLFEELFNQNNSKAYNELAFLYIPDQYVKYQAFVVREYDGLETIELNEDKLAIEMIKEIMNDNSKSQSKKISEITDILEQPF
jgi:hypothetical protein